MSDKGKPKKKNDHWPLRVFFLAVVLSALLSFFSSAALGDAGYVVAVLVGGALYAGVYPVLFGKGVEMQFVLLTAACFTAGILISQLVTMRDSVLRTLQDRDEGGR